MKVFNVVFIVLFVLSAALQYNDPDPYVWMPIYLYAAFLCWQSIKGKYKPVLFIVGIVAYSLYALYLLFDKTGVLNWVNQHNAENIVPTMKAGKPWIEETREFFGLVIVLAVLITNMIWLRKYGRAGRL
jgi:general stress protein CsbA